MVTPQPFEIKLIEPAAPAGPDAPDWPGATKQLRSVAQWVIGGVVATAAGVFAGGSLSNIGAMGFADDADRLWLALGGVSVGFFAIAVIMFHGLAVLAPHGHNLHQLAEAPEGSVDEQARKRLYELHRIKETDAPLDAMLAQQETHAFAKEFLPSFYAASPFCAVRARFDRLIRRMAVCVPIAIVGFGLFAWAANPPDKPAAPERGVVLKITY